MSHLLSPEAAAPLLAAGELVAIPTETVYGLAAHALDEQAVHKIFQVKGRPASNPIIAHLADTDAVFQLGEDPGCAAMLAEQFWPGPMTLLLPHRGRVPDILTAGSELCGFRIPNHPLCLELLKICKFPLAAPSANLSNRRSPTTAAMVLDQLGDQIAGVIDGGACQVGLESSVIEVLDKATVRLHRPGQISRQDLEQLGLRVLDKSKQEKQSTESLISPGQLANHYQPDVPLVLLSQPDADRIDAFFVWARSQKIERLAVLDFGPVNNHSLSSILKKFQSANPSSREKQLAIESVNLSADGSLAAAAHNLFQYFDQLARTHDALISWLLPGTGLAEAINDRLRRAASRGF